MEPTVISAQHFQADSFSNGPLFLHSQWELHWHFVVCECTVDKHVCVCAVATSFLALTDRSLEIVCYKSVDL